VGGSGTKWSKVVGGGKHAEVLESDEDQVGEPDPQQKQRTRYRLHLLIDRREFEPCFAATIQPESTRRVA
jgi:hypothetical protein